MAPPTTESRLQAASPLRAATTREGDRRETRRDTELLLPQLLLGRFGAEAGHIELLLRRHGRQVYRDEGAFASGRDLTNEITRLAVEDIGLTERSIHGGDNLWEPTLDRGGRDLAIRKIMEQE